MSRGRPKEMNIGDINDPFSSESDLKDIIGGKHVINFIKTEIGPIVSALDTPTQNHLVFFPSTTTVMLYGRKGSGKSTLISSALGSQFNELKEGDAGSRYRDFKFTTYNHDRFLLWSKNIIKEVVACNWKRKGPMLIYISNCQQLNYLHQMAYELALIELLSLCKHQRIVDHVRVVLTSSESPGKFHNELRSLVDLECYVAPPNPDERAELLFGWMQKFYDYCGGVPGLSKLDFDDIDLSDDAWKKDPQHVINSLCLYSQGANPRELLSFLQRAFRACMYPNPDGTTEFSNELIEKLLYREEGNIRLTPYDPQKLNEDIRKHAGVDAEVSRYDLGVAGLSGKAVNPSDQPLRIDAHAPEKTTKKKKRKKVDFDEQQKTVADASAKKKKITKQMEKNNEIRAEKRKKMKK